jgi:uncharacterized protein
MTTTRCAILLLSAAALLGSACDREAGPPDAYTAEITEWRSDREARLQAEGGWLSVVGLHWLEPGRNEIGSDPANDVVLGSTDVPRRLGAITLEEGKARFDALPGSGVTHRGEPFTSLELAPDTTGSPTEVRIGSLAMTLIERGGKIGLRVKDSESRARKSFRGIDSYRIDEQWRKVARFEPYDPPREIPIANVLGMVEPMRSPGAVVFEAGGSEYRLDALNEEGSDELFLIFADATSGRETYGGGRYLYAAPPEDGKTVVDFNKAYNPPCVFTEFATCPLPPMQNRLPVAIEAGEKNYRH